MPASALGRKPFDKPKLTIQIVLPAAVAFSKRMFAVCYLQFLFLDENHVVPEIVPLPDFFDAS